MSYSLTLHLLYIQYIYINKTCALQNTPSAEFFASGTTSYNAGNYGICIGVLNCAANRLLPGNKIFQI